METRNPQCLVVTMGAWRTCLVSAAGISFSMLAPVHLCQATILPVYSGNHGARLESLSVLHGARFIRAAKGKSP